MLAEGAVTQSESAASDRDYKRYAEAASAAMRTMARANIELARKGQQTVIRQFRSAETRMHSGSFRSP